MSNLQLIATVAVTGGLLCALIVAYGVVLDRRSAQVAATERAQELPAMEALRLRQYTTGMSQHQLLEMGLTPQIIDDELCWAYRGQKVCVATPAHQQWYAEQLALASQIRPQDVVSEFGYKVYKEAHQRAKAKQKTTA